MEVGQITRLFNSNPGETNGEASSKNPNPTNVLAQELSLEDLARYTRRSYPDYLLGDSEIWLEIEQEFGINWALSMEEEKFSMSYLPRKLAIVPYQFLLMDGRGVVNQPCYFICLPIIVIAIKNIIYNIVND